MTTECKCHYEPPEYNTQSAGVPESPNFFPTFLWHFFCESEGLDQRISKYGVLGATKKNFSLLRGVEQTSTPTYFFFQSKGKIFCSGIFGPEIITIEFRSRFPLILMCHTWYIRDNLEELFQEETIRDIKVNPYEYEKKIFNNTCRTFFKPGASRDEEYIIGRTLSRWTVTWTRRRTPTSSRRTSSNTHIAPLSNQEHPDKKNTSSG